MTFARNRELARRAERIVGADLFGRTELPFTSSSYPSDGCNSPLCPQVVVEGQHHDRGVARVAPLGAAPVLDQPIGHRLDQFVLRIDRQQRANANDVASTPPSDQRQ